MVKNRSICGRVKVKINGNLFGDLRFSREEGKHVTRCAKCQRLAKAREALGVVRSRIFNLDSEDEFQNVAHRLVSRVMRAAHLVRERSPAQVLFQELLLVLESVLEAQVIGGSSFLSRVPEVVVDAAISVAGGDAVELERHWKKALAEKPM